MDSGSVAFMVFGASVAALLFGDDKLRRASHNYELLERRYSREYAEETALLVWSGLYNKLASGIFLVLAMVIMVSSYGSISSRHGLLAIASACVYLVHQVDVLCYAYRRRRIVTAMAMAVERIKKNSLDRWQVMYVLTCMLLALAVTAYGVDVLEHM